MKNITRIFFICLTMSAYQISAQEGRKTIFLEFAYEKGVLYPDTNVNKFGGPLSSDRRRPLENFNFYTSNVWSDEDKLVSAYAFKNAPKPKISGQSLTFLFEYMVLNKLGIGLSVTESEYKGSNFSLSKGNFLILANLLRQNTNLIDNVTNEQISRIESLLPYFQYSINPIANIRTLNFNLAYHFMENSIFDPYLRLYLGYGKYSSLDPKVYHSGIGIGTRIFFNNNIYLLTEILTSRYDAYDTRSSFLQIGNSEEIRVWTINKVNAKIGAGINF